MSDNTEREEFEAMAEEIERLQKALVFWMPDVPSPDHPLYKRVANDAYLRVGCDGPNPEPSAFELGHVTLAEIRHPNTAKPEEEEFTDSRRIHPLDHIHEAEPRLRGMTERPMRIAPGRAQVGA